MENCRWIGKNHLFMTLFRSAKDMILLIYELGMNTRYIWRLKRGTMGKK
jgi:hypothetical protein